MWHEARKQEKKIKCMLVDYQRRAQRRKEYHDKIKSDPTEFLQLHGRSCKIHLDPAVSIAADSSATMMPWQGNPAIMIDRFDVRAHLDYIPEVTDSREPDEELTPDERQTNYERYRILVQNDFFNIPEGKFLNQIHMEEKFGSSLRSSEEPTPSKKRSSAAIGYSYNEDDTSVLSPVDKRKNDVPPVSSVNENVDDENDSDSDFDLDLTVDVTKIETQQANELNTCAHDYGMMTNDFFSFLNNDLEEAENLRIAREREEEKAMFSGRKSRKERRAFRERNFIFRKLSPPSYACRQNPSYEDYKVLVSSNRSKSKSMSPVNSGKITYITSFGNDEPVTSSSSSSKNNVRKKVSRSRSGSRDIERSKRARRSRSASADYRRRSSRWKRSRSSSRDNSKSERSESRSSPRTQSNVLETVVPNRVADSDKSSFDNNSNSTSIPRYYGRRKEQSSSELSLSSSEDESNKQNRTDKSKSYQVSVPCRVAASNKNSPSDKLTPQERLRRKRQVMLNKQFKADKRAEREKALKQVQERIDRGEEMKEISNKLRRRQRKLHRNDSPRRHSSRSRSSSSDRSSVSKLSRNRRQSKHRRSSDDSSTDSSKDRGDNRRVQKKDRSSVSRSPSRSRSRSYDRSIRGYSRQRSRSPRKGRYSEERDTKRKEYNRDSNTRPYRASSEEKKFNADRRDYKSDYKSRRERSPLRRRLNNRDRSDDRMRNRIRENDFREGTSRSSFGGRRSPFRDPYFIG